jgi:hypothetical protein
MRRIAPLSTSKLYRILELVEDAALFHPTKTCAIFGISNANGITSVPLAEGEATPNLANDAPPRTE